MPGFATAAARTLRHRGSGRYRGWLWAREHIACAPRHPRDPLHSLPRQRVRDLPGPVEIGLDRVSGGAGPFVDSQFGVDGADNPVPAVAEFEAQGVEDLVVERSVKTVLLQMAECLRVEQVYCEEQRAANRSRARFQLECPPRWGPVRGPARAERPGSLDTRAGLGLAATRLGGGRGSYRVCRQRGRSAGEKPGREDR